MKKHKERKKYSDLFEQRFKNKLNVSEYKYDEDFYIIFIERIQEEYEKIIKNNKIDNYIRNERTRLEIKIKQLETSEVGSKYTGNVFSTIIPIMTFGIGVMTTFSRESVKFVADNKLKQSPTDKGLWDNVAEVFKNFSSDMIDIVSSVTIYLLIIIFGAAVVLGTLYEINSQKKSRNIAFNTFCLEVVKRIEKNESNKLDDIELKVEAN